MVLEGFMAPILMGGLFQKGIVLKVFTIVWLVGLPILSACSSWSSLNDVGTSLPLGLRRLSCNGTENVSDTFCDVHPAVINFSAHELPYEHISIDRLSVGISVLWVS